MCNVPCCVNNSQVWNPNKGQFVSWSATQMLILFSFLLVFCEREMIGGVVKEGGKGGGGHGMSTFLVMFSSLCVDLFGKKYSSAKLLALLQNKLFYVHLIEFIFSNNNNKKVSVSPLMCFWFPFFVVTCLHQRSRCLILSAPDSTLTLLLS